MKTKWNCFKLRLKISKKNNPKKENKRQNYHITFTSKFKLYNRFKFNQNHLCCSSRSWTVMELPTLSFLNLIFLILIQNNLICLNYCIDDFKNHKTSPLHKTLLLLLISKLENNNLSKFVEELFYWKLFFEFVLFAVSGFLISYNWLLYWLTTKFFNKDIYVSTINK